MAKAKLSNISADYLTGAVPDTAVVQKARPLLALSESDLTLPELKILDLYLARINSHDPSACTVILEAGELEQALEVTRIPRTELLGRLRGLFTAVELPSEDGNGSAIRLIALFREAGAVPDADGVWTVTLTCTDEARRYIFNIDDLGYLRYRLSCVIRLTSRYSYSLFLYLLDNKFRGTWAVDVDFLRKRLRCDADRYQAYKYFSQEVLKMAQAEIHAKTDLRCSFTPIKRGRRVVQIQWTVQSSGLDLEAEAKAKAEAAAEQTVQASQASQDYDPVGYVVTSVCMRDGSPEWTREEAEALYALLVSAMPERMLSHRGSQTPDDCRRAYLRMMYARLTLAAHTRRIPHRYAYLTQIIRRDLQEQQPQATQAQKALSPSAQRAHNFPERTTDYDAAILRRIRNGNVGVGLDLNSSDQGQDKPSS